MLGVAAALILDALVGERAWTRLWLPHPVVVMGNAIAWLEGRLNNGHARRVRGALALGLLLVLGIAVAVAVARLPFGWVAEIVLGAVLLAQRSLVDHVSAVARGLDVSLEAGRHAVSMIVGRDPTTLDEAGVARAAIESAAENFSDGLAAPVFWFAVAGLPGIVAYKLVNTADSMIGHRSERYRDYGWAAARLDDAMNLIPARLTGLVFCAVAGRGLRVMRRDAPHHRSPNAGWPEAAMAVALDLALAGPRTYAEGVVDDPFMHAEGRREATPRDIDASIRMLWRAWVVIVAAALLGGSYTALLA